MACGGLDKTKKGKMACLLAAKKKEEELNDDELAYLNTH